MLEQLRIPVIAAPMGGGVSTPELAAAVSGAGGLGFLAGAYLTPTALNAEIERYRSLTDAPCAVNLFVPGRPASDDLTGYREELAAEAAHYGVALGEPSWDDDQYAAKLDVVVAQEIPLVSCTFGCPAAADVRRLHDAGAEVVVTVTTRAEARQAVAAGADALCVQGFEAGAHRGLFQDDPASQVGGPSYGLLALLCLVSADVDVPLIAAGGLMTGADVAAVLAAGAVAAQLGTAFLLCPEAGTKPAHRVALAAGARDTEVTRAYTGRPARGLVNRFMTEHGPQAPAGYPELHHLTKAIRAAAGRAGDPEAMSLWAGQTYSLARALPAADLVRAIDSEARGALAAAANRWAR